MVRCVNISKAGNGGIKVFNGMGLGLFFRLSSQESF